MCHEGLYLVKITTGMWTNCVLLSYIWIVTACKVESLKCWKCISHDCSLDPEANYKATAVKCHDGQECMKVRYRMFDNVTHYDSVVRTCSSGTCEDTTDNDFERCVATPKLYMISGCTLRSCCSDKDLCNFSSTVAINPVCLFLALFRLTLFVLY